MYVHPVFLLEVTSCDSLETYLYQGFTIEKERVKWYNFDVKGGLSH